MEPVSHVSQVAAPPADQRRFWRYALFVLFLIGAAVGGGVWWALHQEPDFYHDVAQAIESPEVRQVRQAEFNAATASLAAEIRAAPTWQQEFSEQQLNAALAEDGAIALREAGVTEVQDVRVKITPEGLLVGFKFDNPDWRGIVSLRLRPAAVTATEWKFEIDSVKAGLVGLPVNKLLDMVSQRLREEGIPLHIAHAEDRWTVSIECDRVWERVQAAEGAAAPPSRQPQRRAHPELEQIEFFEGRLRVSGHTDDAERAAVAPAAER